MGRGQAVGTVRGWQPAGGPGAEHPGAAGSG